LALPFIAQSDFEEKFGPLPDNAKNADFLWEGSNTDFLHYPLKRELSDMEFTLTRAVIQGATSLHKPQNVLSKEITTMGAAIRELDKQVAALDDEQEAVALQMAPGPQRIRGLAGTGKTVLLAMKAAHIHIKEPDKKILFTFNTQSLYNQARELISKTYRAHCGTDPNWDQLHIRHAWGGRGRAGVYSDICARQDVPPLTFNNVRGTKNALQLCCLHALQRPISEEYDFILVDEAQDFPKEFFRIFYKLSHAPEHRIYWAYDELQSLSSLEIPKPESLFGIGDDGKPLISLEGENYPGEIEKDIVLYQSYRCPLTVLMLAHAIGLGLHNPNGSPVQMLEDKGYWEAIGYTVESGKLQKGEDVVIYRDPANSPNRIYEIYNKQELVTRHVFQDRSAELDWIAESIKKDIREENVPPRQIVVISLDTPKAKEYLIEIQIRLMKYDILSTIIGIIEDTTTFSEEGRVTLSNVLRAKGNEACLVYIMGFDALYEDIEGISSRNHAFTAITRAKGWVRITGTGAKMDMIKEEIDTILANVPKFKFKVSDIQKFRFLKNMDNVNKSVDTLIKMSPEVLGTLDPKKIAQLRKLLNEVANENQ
jgi:superfamily I DNA and RNA helicase